MQQNEKKQSFVQGAFVLIAAGLMVKVIGALYKIPLQHLLLDEGMGWYSVAYQLYTAMFVISTAGVPAALSKMVAEAYAVGREKEITRTVRVAAGLFLSIGLVCSLLLWFGAEWICTLIGNPNAWYAVRAIAPAVFLVSVISIMRGYYQGLANMVPTAISQIIEALCKLGLGLGLAYLANQMGLEVPMVAAAAIVGITIGEAVAAVYLLIRTAIDRKKPRRSLTDASRSQMEILRIMLCIAVPITVTSAVTSITTLVDTAMVMNRLQDAGYTAEQANELFGIYNAKAFTMFNLPQTLITALSTSVLPAVAGAYKRQNFTIASNTTGSAVRLAMLIALPAATGYLLLADPIIDLLYAGDIATAAGLLRILAFAIPCVALVGLSNALLQAIGKVQVPLITMLIGMCLKLAINYTLVGMPTVNIYGAPIGTLVCYLTIATINLCILSKKIKLPAVGKPIGKTLAACVGMGAVASGSYAVLSGVVGSSVGVLLAIALAGVTYLALLLALGGLLREDVLLMPKGETLVRVLRIKA